MNTEIERIIEDLKDVLFLFKIRKEIDLNKSSVLSSSVLEDRLLS